MDSKNIKYVEGKSFTTREEIDEKIMKEIEKLIKDKIKENRDVGNRVQKNIR